MSYTLWHGDCLEEMSRIEAGSVDCILADLPYNVTNCHWDTLIPFEPLWKQYKRVIKKRGAVVLFGSEPFSSLLRLSNIEWFKYDWIWKKTRASDHVRAKCKPLRIHEDILIFSPGSATNRATNPMTYNPQGLIYNPQIERRPGRKISAINGDRPCMKTEYLREYENYPTTIIEFANPNNHTVHPSQKPVALLSYLIKTYTNEGDTVLDNTCGSGSTLEAAMRCNRRSIGIEKDLGYYNVAAQRLERVAAELRGELNHLPMFAEQYQ